mgnify:CR=1 FL=1
MKEDQLFSLISSLNKTEKSYFKKVKSSFGSKDSTLLKIFDAIQLKDEYDEKAVMDKIKFEGTNNSFSVKKHALYNGIVDILSLNKSMHKDVLWQINRLIAHGLILKEKKQFKSAKQTFQKAYKSALENEFFYKQIEVNQQLIEIFRKTTPLTDFNALNELEAHRIDILEISKQLTNNEEYYLLADQIHLKSELLSHTSDDNLINEINELYKSNLLKSEDNAKSKTALACYHYILQLKYINLPNETDKALYHLEQIISIQENLKRFPLRSRFVQLGNFVRLAIANGKQESATKMLNKMGEIYKNTKDNFIQIFHCVHLDYFHVHKKSKNDYFIFHEIMEEELADLVSKIPFNMEVMDLKHAQFRYEFLKGNFKKAFSISNFIDQEHDLHSFKNGKLSEKLLKALVCFEMKDFDLMSSEIRSIRHLLKSVQSPLNSELKVYHLLRDLLKNNSSENEKKIFQNFLDETEESISSNGSFIIYDMKFRLWVQSKIEKTSYPELFFK